MNILYITALAQGHFGFSFNCTICSNCLSLLVSRVHSLNVFPQVLRWPYTWHQAESSIFCQRLLRRDTHPIAVGYFIHLPGDCDQRHHVWGLAGRRHWKHAGGLTAFGTVNVLCANNVWVERRLEVGLEHTLPPTHPQYINTCFCLW